MVGRAGGGCAGDAEGEEEKNIETLLLLMLLMLSVTSVYCSHVNTCHFTQPYQPVSLREESTN